MIHDDSFCRSRLEEYQSKHPDFCNHYLFKSFIKKQKNKEILMKALLNPNEENKKALDQSFKNHHFHLKFLSYLSKTLHFNAVRYDQKRRRDHNKNLLILDAPARNDESTPSIIDQLSDTNQDLEKMIFSRLSTIDEHLSDDKLVKKFNTLTPIQKEVLTLYYLYSYTDSEIAQFQKKSQQSVFKTRKRALLKLKQRLRE